MLSQLSRGCALHCIWVGKKMSFLWCVWPCLSSLPWPCLKPRVVWQKVLGTEGIKGLSSWKLGSSILLCCSAFKTGWATSCGLGLLSGSFGLPDHHTRLPQVQVLQSPELPYMAFTGFRLIRSFACFCLVAFFLWGPKWTIKH